MLIPSASGYLHTRINCDVLTYLPSDIETNEPAKIAKIYVTVYYAEKGEQKLHHFKKSMDIGNGHGGIVSQLKYNNEMKLTDELGQVPKRMQWLRMQEKQIENRYSRSRR